MAGYFQTSPFDGAEAGDERRRALYDAMARERFARAPQSATREELLALDRYLALRLDLEREERRMHFGALALVSLLLFLLLPALVERGFSDLALDALALLLLALLVPYILVYYGYENRVRAMGAGRLRLLEAMERIDPPVR